WSASIRFFFMLPMLLIFVRLRKQVLPVLHHINKYPKEWIILSTIGFCFFYAPLTFATIHAPGWLVAATFQLNIVAGSLLVPFINKSNRSIPIQSVFISYFYHYHYRNLHDANGTRRKRSNKSNPFIRSSDDSCCYFLSFRK